MYPFESITIILCYNIVCVYVIVWSDVHNLFVVLEHSPLQNRFIHSLAVDNIYTLLSDHLQTVW